MKRSIIIMAVILSMIGIMAFSLSTVNNHPNVTGETTQKIKKDSIASVKPLNRFIKF